MTLLKWKPYGDLIRLGDRINRLFENDLMGEGIRGTEGFTDWNPATDIYETKENYVFKLEVPGIKKDDIDIDLKENILSIRGEKREDNEIKKENYHRVESFCGTFSRSFTIPKDIDPKKIEATMKDGILELKIGKADEVKAKKIPIDIK
ncbi:MAG: Hsp20/alpha crystallin family protein [Acidobacteriota bacterium]